MLSVTIPVNVKPLCQSETNRPPRQPLRYLFRQPEGPSRSSNDWQATVGDSDRVSTSTIELSSTIPVRPSVQSKRRSACWSLSTWNSGVSWPVFPTRTPVRICRHRCVFAFSGVMNPDPTNAWSRVSLSKTRSVLDQVSGKFGSLDSLPGPGFSGLVVLFFSHPAPAFDLPTVGRHHEDETTRGAIGLSPLSRNRSTVFGEGSYHATT
jgi:hypothetical protein